MPSDAPDPLMVHFHPDHNGVEEVDLDDLAAHCRIIDVRSPGEFEQDHIPGSSNVPLLGDAERAVVGTLYRVKGKESATQWALHKLQSRSDDFLAALRSQIGCEEQPVICCARGGDRSRNVVQFLNQQGVSAKRLTGGYRSYRKTVIGRLEQIQLDGLWVLDGLTGAGKTAVLQSLACKYPGRVLDLEEYAGHRSSILGDVGKLPKTQKQFESLLAAALDALDDNSPWILIEGESRKVGNRQIPKSLWDMMQTAPRIELVRDLDSRARLLVEEYRTEEGWGPVIERVEALRAYDPLGSEGVDAVQSLLRCEQPVDAAKILLQKHYDPRYLHGSEQRTYSFRISEISTDEAVHQLLQALDS